MFSVLFEILKTDTCKIPHDRIFYHSGFSETEKLISYSLILNHFGFRCPTDTS